MPGAQISAVVPVPHDPPGYLPGRDRLTPEQLAELAAPQRDLLVLTPAGTGRVTYRWGEGGSATGADGVLTVEVLRSGRQVPTDGTLTVDAADGGTLYSGPIDDRSPAVQRSVVVDLAGARPVGYDGTRLTATGQRLVRDNAISQDVPDVAQVSIVAACAGEGGTTVAVRGTTVAVPCDERNHEVYRGTFDKRTDLIETTATGPGANLWTDFVIDAVG